MVAGLASAASIKVYQTDGNANDDPWTQINDERCQPKKKFYAAPNAFLHALRLSFKGAKAVPARKYHA